MHARGRSLFTTGYSETIFDRWIKSAQAGLFGVLFTMAKDTTSHTHWSVFALAFDFAQLLLYPLSPAKAFPWAAMPVVKPFITVLSYVNPNAAADGVSHQLKLSLLFLACAWVFATIVCVAWSAYSFSRGSFATLAPLRFLRATARITVSALFVPAAALLMGVYKCKEGTNWGGTSWACYGREHMSLVTIVSLLLPCFWAFTLVVSAVFFDRDYASGNVTARSHGRVGIAMITIKSGLTLMFALAADADPWFLHVLVLFAGVAWMWLWLRYLPLYTQRMNRTWAALGSVFTWAAVCACTAKLLNDPKSGVAGYLLYLGSPAAAYAGYALASMRFHALGRVHMPAPPADGYTLVRDGGAERHGAEPYDAERCELERHEVEAAMLAGVRSPFDVELRVRYILRDVISARQRSHGHAHDTHSTPLVAPASASATRHDNDTAGGASEEAKERDAIARAQHLFLVARRMFPHAATLDLFYANFLRCFTTDRDAELQVINAGLAKDAAMDVRFLLAQSKRQLEESVTAHYPNAGAVAQGRMSIIERVQYEQLMSESIEQSMRARTTELAFWAELRQPLPQLARLHTLSEGMSTAVTRAATAFDKLLALRPSSVEVLQSYAVFLLEVKREAAAAARYFDMADDILGHSPGTVLLHIDAAPAGGRGVSVKPTSPISELSAPVNGVPVKSPVSPASSLLSSPAATVPLSPVDSVALGIVKSLAKSRRSISAASPDSAAMSPAARPPHPQVQPSRRGLASSASTATHDPRTSFRASRSLSAAVRTSVQPVFAGGFPPTEPWHMPKMSASMDADRVLTDGSTSVFSYEATLLSASGGPVAGRSRRVLDPPRLVTSGSIAGQEADGDDAIVKGKNRRGSAAVAAYAAAVGQQRRFSLGNPGVSRATSVASETMERTDATLLRQVAAPRAPSKRSKSRRANQRGNETSNGSPAAPSTTVEVEPVQSSMSEEEAALEAREKAREKLLIRISSDARIYAQRRRNDADEAAASSLRMGIKAKASVMEPVLVALGRALLLLCVSAIALLITGAVVQRQLLTGYVTSMQLVRLAADRQLVMERAMDEAYTLSRIQAGIVAAPASIINATTANLVVLGARLAELHRTAVLSDATIAPDELREWGLTAIPVQDFVRANTSTTRYISLANLGVDMAAKIGLLSALPLSALSAEHPLMLFVMTNGAGPARDAFRASTLLYSAKMDAFHRYADTLDLAFAAATCVLFGIVSLLVLFPLVTRVKTYTDEVFATFLNLPELVLKDMHTTCATQIAALKGLADDPEAIALATELDAQQVDMPSDCDVQVTVADDSDDTIDADADSFREHQLDRGNGRSQRKVAFQPVDNESPSAGRHDRGKGPNGRAHKYAPARHAVPAEHTYFETEEQRSDVIRGIGEALAGEVHGIEPASPSRHGSGLGQLLQDVGSFTWGRPQGRRVVHRAFKASQGMRLRLLARFVWPLAILALFFLSIWLYEVSSLAAAANAKTYTVAFGQVRTNMWQMNALLQQTILDLPRPDADVATRSSAIACSSSALTDRTQYVDGLGTAIANSQDALLFGSSADAARDTATALDSTLAAVMLNDVCRIPGVATDCARRPGAYRSVLAGGLQAATREYLTASKQQVQVRKAVVSAFASASNGTASVCPSLHVGGVLAELGVLHDMLQRVLDVGFEFITDLLAARVESGVLSFLLVHAVLTSVCVCAIAITWLLLYARTLRKMDADLKRTRGTLLMFPTDVLAGVAEFLEQREDAFSPRT